MIAHAYYARAFCARGYAYYTHAMDGPRRNQICKFCNQELSHAAYYRHLQDRSGCVCPGLRDISASESSSSDEVLSVSSGDSDTSFDFDSPSMEEIIARNDSGDISMLHEVSSESDCDLSESDIDSDQEDDDLQGEEIWEYSDDEENSDSDQISVPQRMLVGISFFLTKFQLFFKISERAMTALLLLWATIFMHLNSIINHPILEELCRIIPKTMWSIKKKIGTQTKGVVDYVICPKCHSLFTLSDCSLKQHDKITYVDKLCDHIEYPNHTQRSRRSKCNTPLMKRVKIGGKLKFVPRKVYQYHSIVDSLKDLISRQGFLSECEYWRKRSVDNDTYADIFDGNVWKDLQYIDGVPFLAAPHNLSMMMNVDWFNPYTESQYSAGAIYLIILNLPRAVRYKFENILLVGLIPGPKEPSLNINSYLSPLVDDFKLLFQGVTFKNRNSLFGSSTVRAVLSCIGSDLPATRKICGFLSHSASLGCSKCLKKFPSSSFGEKLDYSGFNVDSWDIRRNENHKENANSVYNARTATARVSLERKYGLRYSVLLNLPTFDVVRYHTIDPMHNIFLGIAKLCIKIWKDKEILRACHFDTIQCKVDMMVPPPNIGRIPRKIGSGFSAFTADEWKHWILIYSMFALHGILPERDYNCWFLFVKFCRNLCKSTISRQEILHAHELVLEFCNTFQELYGTAACTPNLHMACHLKDSLLDYGPLPAFWCFSFERYNGILEGMCKSWITPEKQMFSKFLNLQYIDSLHTQYTNLPEKDFVKIISATPFFQSSKVHSSVEQTSIDGMDITQQIKNHTCEVSGIDATVKCYHSLSSPQVEKVFNDRDMECLKEMYGFLYPSNMFKIIQISRFYLESKHIFVHGLQLISTKARSERSAAIVAHWRNGNCIDLTGQAPLKAGIITSIFCHDLQVEVGSAIVCKKNLLARVDWLEYHPKQDQYIATVMVTSTLPDTQNSSNFIPVARIAARCALISKIAINFDYGEDNVCICVPLIKGILV